MERSLNFNKKMKCWTWNKFDSTNYVNGISNKKSEKLIKMKLLQNFQNQLEINQPRDEYKELLQLCAIFLEENNPSWSIRVPGAYYRVRVHIENNICIQNFSFSWAI